MQNIDSQSWCPLNLLDPKPRNISRLQYSIPIEKHNAKDHKPIIQVLYKIKKKKDPESKHEMGIYIFDIENPIKS